MSISYLFKQPVSITSKDAWDKQFYVVVVGHNLSGMIEWY